MLSFLGLKDELCTGQETNILVLLFYQLVKLLELTNETASPSRLSCVLPVAVVSFPPWLYEVSEFLWSVCANELWCQWRETYCVLIEGSGFMKGRPRCACLRLRRWIWSFVETATPAAATTCQRAYWWRKPPRFVWLKKVQTWFLGCCSAEGCSSLLFPKNLVFLFNSETCRSIICIFVNHSCPPSPKTSAFKKEQIARITQVTFANFQ